jgi:RNA polymerase sigma-70 factor (ECF subfamily)
MKWSPLVDTARDSMTSTTLLARLQLTPADQAAWTEFVESYGPRIQNWCRQWGLQDADAGDVSQTVLVKLMNAMQTFRYDRSKKFRSWLKTVAHHAWQDWVRSRKQVAIGGEPPADFPLHSLEARDDLAARIEQAYEHELLGQAMAQICNRVQPQTWNAFRLTALEGHSGAEAAARLDMPVTSIYKAKSNVQRLLEEEVRLIEGEHP